MEWLDLRQPRPTFSCRILFQFLDALRDRLARYSWTAYVSLGHLNAVETFGHLLLTDLIQEGPLDDR